MRLCRTCCEALIQMKYPLKKKYLFLFQKGKLCHCVKLCVVWIMSVKCVKGRRRRRRKKKDYIITNALDITADLHHRWNRLGKDKWRLTQTNCVFEHQNVPSAVVEANKPVQTVVLGNEKNPKSLFKWSDLLHEYELSMALSFRRHISSPGFGIPHVLHILVFSLVPTLPIQLVSW